MRGCVTFGCFGMWQELIELIQSLKGELLEAKKQVLVVEQDIRDEVCQ